ncbi:MAG: hypothetical protein ABIV12_13055 [Dokdonella sp.]
MNANGAADSRVGAAAGEGSLDSLFKTLILDQTRRYDNAGRAIYPRGDAPRSTRCIAFNAPRLSRRLNAIDGARISTWAGDGSSR